MPTEKSLQRLRPRHEESPACQARRSTGTNCTTSASRRTRKCEETLSSWISLKYGCAAGSRRLLKKRSIASPPYSPGGRVIEWISTRLTSVPGGRSSWLGESTTLIGDAQALHAITQLAEGDAQELGGRGAVEAGLAERFEDRLALEVVEVLRQGLAVAFARGLGRLFGRGHQAQIGGADALAGRERQRALEDVLELGHVAREVVGRQLLQRLGLEAR